MPFRSSTLIPSLLSLAVVAFSLTEPLLGNDQPRAMASFSSRAAKPGDRMELVVTVRHALHPVIPSIERPSQLHFHILRKPQLLHAEEGDVWLFRYRVIPSQSGDYELPPICVIDGNRSIMTKPILLHVSGKGELPRLTAKELSLAVNIPMGLSEEVLKSAPQPTPKAEPSPTPPDTRPFTSKAASTCWKELKAFWNYPGK